jgi:hypothetical protein
VARRADPPRADKDAEYAEIIEIDMDQIKEPLLACPNDPDDVKKLSEVAGTKIDEVFIGSCMTNIGHFRAAGMLLEKFGGARADRASGSRRPRKHGPGRSSCKRAYYAHVRGRGRAHRDAGLLALHGQPGAA